MGNGTLLSVTGDDLAVELLSRWIVEARGELPRAPFRNRALEGLNLNARFKPN